MKEIINRIAHPYSVLINRSMYEGIFPAVLKTAKTMPIYKKGSWISLLIADQYLCCPTFQRSLKELYLIECTNFIDKLRILDSLKFGFRTKHSTIDAVALLFNAILKSFNNKDSVIAICCDLSKTFDTLFHRILLCKLNKYGIGEMP